MYRYILEVGRETSVGCLWQGPHGRTRPCLWVPPTPPANSGRHPVLGPWFFPLAVCLCGGGRRAWKCGLQEKVRPSGKQGKCPVPRTQSKGPCEPGMMTEGWSTLPRGREALSPGRLLVLGVAVHFCPTPHPGPKRASRDSD